MIFSKSKSLKYRKYHLVMFRSSHSSDGSVETVVGQDVSVNSFDPGLISPLQDVRAREKELGARLNRKHSDIYIVNGSDVSKASSKASTKISKKSSNYDPLPHVKLVSK